MFLEGILGRKRTAVTPNTTQTAPAAFVTAEYSLISALWKGIEVVVKVRNLSPVQFRACGDVSFINLMDGVPEHFSWKKWVQYAETNYRILRAALVEPTYDELMATVNRGTMVADAEARFKEINAQIKDMPRGPARQELENLRDATRCMYDLVFPDDFVSSIVLYQGAPPGSDIRKVVGERGREMLLEAAILAERGHDNPHDHMLGNFTPFNLIDIDKQAWLVLADHRESLKRRRGGVA